MTPAFDLVIRSGTLVDGRGGEPFEADVAVLGGRIAALGSVTGSGREEINARGLIVTPGFIDIHTHYDGAAIWESRLSPSSDHGVTTAVMGNCSVGFAPCRADQRALLVDLMAGVEDIPEVVMTEGLPWTWETFPEYLDALATRRLDMDVCAQVPHAAVRVYVMGERGARREPANARELARMTRIVRDALRAGAFGVSTSRTLFHRTRSGELAPSETASESELMALARGIRESGRPGVFEVSAEFQGLALDDPSEFEMLQRLARTSGGPLSYSLAQTWLHPRKWRDLLQRTEAAQAQGIPLWGQVAARQNGFLLGLDLSYHPFCFTPTWRTIAHLPLPEKVAAMRDPDVRRRMLGDEWDSRHNYLLYLFARFGDLMLLGNPPDYEPPAARRVEALAKARGVTARELAYDLLLEDEGRRMLLLPITNFVDGDLDAVGEMLASGATLLGLSDGGAHYGLVCDAGFPTFLLAHWARDRHRQRLSPQQAVKKLTLDNARYLSLADRGVIAPGFKADLNVIDFSRLSLAAPELRHDLPGGARRLVQRARGYVATVVSGTITYRDGEACGALPGRLVRALGSAA